MKDMHFLYVVAILAILGIAAAVIGYATDTLPTHTPQQVTTASTQVSPGTAQAARKTARKKNCSCCAERMEALKKHLRNLREREKAAQEIVTTDTP